MIDLNTQKQYGKKDPFMADFASEHHLIKTKLMIYCTKKLKEQLMIC